MTMCDLVFFYLMSRETGGVIRDDFCNACLTDVPNCVRTAVSNQGD